MYQDKVLVCRDCNREFTFTAGEQEFYAEKGFQNEPTRCPECRAVHKQQRRSEGGGFGASREDRPMYSAVCSECGAETQVPFKPSTDKPVYCKECYQARRSARW